jgi:proline iminopeptidase
MNDVPVAAAVYRDDIFVDRDLSLETAASVRGLRVWETADFHHDGISDDGEGLFARLLGLADPDGQER